MSIERFMAGAGKALVLRGDSAAVLRTLPDASIDALVTDPPAGIEFMGKAWDKFTSRAANPSGPQTEEWGVAGDGNPYTNRPTPRFTGKQGTRNLDARAAFIASLTPIFAECLRVLKPGAHGLVWALPRTSHWTATALEDAGFEVRDRVSHLFGTGFPKSRNEGEGRGTALKPACEDWWLVRKPCAEKTVAANIAKYGTGALNIDKCRIETAPDDAVDNHARGADSAKSKGIYGDSAAQETHQTNGQKLGRWPAHVVLSHTDECVQIGTATIASNGHHPTSRGAGSQISGQAGHAGQDGLEERHARGEVVETWSCALFCPVRLLDESSGTTTSSGGRTVTRSGGGDVGSGKRSEKSSTSDDPGLGDTGGASRFYYVAKPSRAEREAGCAALDAAQRDPTRAPDAPGANNPRNRGGGERHNNHPTVKSIALMRWLLRLITSPGGVVLDPFGGSGTTGCAALLEGARPIVIERDAAYVEIIRARMAHWSKQGDAE